MEKKMNLTFCEQLFLSLRSLDSVIPITTIPTDEDIRGYITLFGVPTDIYTWGGESLQVASIAEFSDHVTFRLSPYYEVSVTPYFDRGHEMTVIDGRTDTLVATHNCPNIKSLYWYLVGLVDRSTLENKNGAEL